MKLVYKISDNIISCVKPYISDKSDDDLEIAKYGLNLFFMELYKLPILFGLAYYLGVLKYCIIVYILFGIIRNYAKGLHMKSGKGCLVYSCMTFFSIIYISKYLLIHWSLKLLISSVILYFIYKYAPADTEAKPLLNKNTREKNKKLSIFIGTIYISMSLITSDKVMSNILLLVLVLECIVIHPITYKIFKRRYNNYEHFQ